MNINLRTLTLCALASASMLLTAQTVVKQKNGVKVDLDGKPTTEVTVYSSNIVRVTKYADGLNQMPEKKSYSVVLTPGKEKFTVEENASAVTLKTENMAVSISKQTGDVAFSNLDGKALLKEGRKSEVKLISSGVDKGRYSISQEFDLDKEEAIFGFGQRKSMKLNQRGEDIDLWNANTNINIPFFSSEKGYGLYWDNAGRSRFNDTKGETVFSSQVAEGVDYYFMYTDGTQDGVIASVRELSDRQQCSHAGQWDTGSAASATRLATNFAAFSTRCANSASLSTESYRTGSTGDRIPTGTQ